jgi:hypothetical protein
MATVLFLKQQGCLLEIQESKSLRNTDARKPVRNSNSRRDKFYSISNFTKRAKRLVFFYGKLSETYLFESMRKHLACCLCSLCSLAMEHFTLFYSPGYATLLFIVIVLRIRALAHNQQIFDLNNQVCEQSEHSITRER